MIERIELHGIGISYRTAGVEVRERLALAPTALDAVLRHHATADRSVLFLSTCNRSEIYWSGAHDFQSWFTEFAHTRGVSDVSALVRWDGDAAVRHLFEVAAGLDSQILGEIEILGQVRRAFDAARAAGTTTWDMDIIFSGALAAGRRVRRETSLGRHPASVSSAAVDVVSEHLNENGRILRDRNIVVLGAGEAAEGVLRALCERGAARVTLVNRRPERAQALASAWDAGVGGWDELPAHLAQADVLFVATAAKHPIIAAAQLSDAVLARGDTAGALVVVDLAVPRNVDPVARELPAVTLFDLDDLQRLRCPATGATFPALADAHRVLEEELTRLDVKLRGRLAGPELAELHRFGVELAERETIRALAKLQGLSEQDQRVVREMADRLIRRVLYPVSRAVRASDL